MEPLRIALRYLLAKRGSNVVSVISLISVTGVGVAAMAIVCVLSVFNGFAILARSQTDTLTPDLRVAPLYGKAIEGIDSVTALISAVPHVKAVVPVLEERALAKCGSRQMPVRIKGVTDNYANVTSIDSVVKSDGMFVLSDSVLGPVATLSVGSAVGLQVRPGVDSYVDIYVPRRRGRINLANPSASFLSGTFAVGGVFQADDAETDADLVLLPFGEAARLLDRDNAASAIEIGLEPGADADNVADVLRERLGNTLSVSTRRQQQQTSMRMIAIEKWITFAMLAFILTIASFNIISTLSMMVIEKTDNIRTLYAMGATRSFIGSIFRYEGWLISLAGGAGGVVAGVVLCLMQQWFGFIKLGGDHQVMVTDVYPVRVEVVDILVVLLLVAAIGWITSAVAAAFSRHRLGLSSAGSHCSGG
ncbi:FtsX-like permease family protein [uncultured Muribaculum sp.]|uniref:FtsX-like permease family protein n=1 Tax=uncultured Muribaculum sp. TaxID=1918613 RepID=UPI0026752FD5|nr:FtsX-like permease family protein [uncultured Muribaculum sp.]